MKVAIVIVSIVGLCLAATTQKPHGHHTHEPNENESLFFLYNPKSHNMLIKQRTGHTYNCYVAMLTDAERATVHTDAGIRTLELKLLGMLSTAKMATMSDLNDADVHGCGHAPHNGTVNYYTL